ncbi:hypothetical protein B0H14DRAFT_2769667, partial [Mycena olivaceomarginata]
MFKLLGLGFATLLLSISGLAAPQPVALDVIARAAQDTVVSVVVKDAATGPAPLPGLMYAHITNTVGTPFSWTDNRVGLAILAYDPNNNLVGRWDMTEARYLLSIVYNSAAGSVVFTGQVGNTITIPIIQLLEPIVFMSTENAATQPAAPSGLDYVTFFGDNTQYPVLIVGTYTYWPLSYVDNRESLNLVGYDQNKNLISQVELPGTRYIETVIYGPDAG